MESYKSGQVKPHANMDFYKLHYPAKKSANLHTPTIRSKSMISVIQSPDNQEVYDPSFIKPRKQLRKNNSNYENSVQKDRIMQKYRQKILKNSMSSNKVTFKRILSVQTSSSQIDRMIPKLPLKSIRDIQQFSSKNLSLKQSIDHFKDEKAKINKLLLSHKQSEQIKLTYLQAKKKQLAGEISREIHQIYDRYFKKQYEAKFGNKVLASAQFQKNIDSLIQKLSANVFQ